ncbi:glycerol-3-phosphate phosphatase-like [Saccoglossus kowalevskii]|uniref:Phosphoglycolate phosphatase-like n=1 Tax=Saccoglossus kowalevskii TaxID=10224 RepID=A0ABM0GZ76_SACKO|nr:PREDICTED: phosphoglycolate phosphatase-like [Saccoglossus kowalevskii]
MAACKELTANLVHDFISSVDTILCDCDGVIWKNNDSIPGAAEALKKLRLKGKRIFFVTNNSTKSRKQYIEKLLNLGFEAYPEEIICTAFAAASYLKHSLKLNGKVYLIGSIGMAEELDLMGIPYFGIGPDPVKSLDMAEWAALPIDNEVKAVLVGFDEHLSYIKLIKAGTYLNDPECAFVATNEDLRYPLGGKIMIPGTGVIVGAVKQAAQREPVVLGKPSKYLFDSIMQSFEGVTPERTVMIGDRLSTDISMGRTCGLKTLLVETGIDTRVDAKENQKSNSIERQKMVPDYFITSLADLGKTL